MLLYSRYICLGRYIQINDPKLLSRILIKYVLISFFRGGVTFLAMILLALLSLVCSTINFKSITKYCLEDGWYNSRETMMMNDDDCTCYYFFLLLIWVIDGCVFIIFYALRIIYFLLFGLVNILPDFYSNLIALYKVNVKKQSPKNFLFYAYLR